MVCIYAKENAKKVLLRKKEQDTPWPRVVLQFIIGENNYNEAGRFLMYWHIFYQIMKFPFLLQLGM